MGTHVSGIRTALVARISQAVPVKPRKRRVARLGQLNEAYASLSLFMFVYCARPEDWIPGLSAAPLAKIAGIFALTAFLLSLDQIRQNIPRETIFTILLAGQLFLGAPFSPIWMGGALNTAIDFAKVGLIVLVMVVAVNTTERLRRVLFIQAVSVAAIGGAAIWKGRMLGMRLEGVLNGNYSNPNDLAISIALSTPLCLVLFLLSKNSVKKAAWILAMAVMGSAVLLTGSRAGFLSLATAAVVCLWEFGIRGHRRYLLGVGAVAVVGLAWSLSGSVVGQRLVGTFNSQGDVESSYGSAQARQALLWRSLEITARYPLFGVGAGNFQQVSGVWHETHNSYTQISSEGGIPALILYVTILWYGFRNLQAIRKISRRSEPVLLAGALRASLAGFVVGSFFASYAYQFFPYFLVAYTTALLRVVKSENALIEFRVATPVVVPMLSVPSTSR
jgi:O-antigen ligase